MNKKINEDVVCVLQKDKCSNRIEIGYLDIVNPIKSIFDSLFTLCDNDNTSIQQIVSYIQTAKEFELINGIHKYCVRLSSPYEGFLVHIDEYIDGINSKYNLYLSNKNDNPESSVFKSAIIHLKSRIKSDFLLWSNAYAIENLYTQCKNDKNILAFSHRICGWSNPGYKLTPNFYIEIITNFGYGSASYFYTKLRYKDIDITPFSDWIIYENANSHEIIRYSKSHVLVNDHWLEAMLFSCEACNLSLTDEEKFVNKYIIDECENMVRGLENFLYKDRFIFTNKKRFSYAVDKQGYVLTEFRGEKISGALDFIGKILSFDFIPSIKSFTTRIEHLNSIIHPILVNETNSLLINIQSLKDEIIALQPLYDNVILLNNEYDIKKDALKDQMIISGDLDPDRTNLLILNAEFENIYTDYKKFKEDYYKVTYGYNGICSNLHKLQILKDKISSHISKIDNYFS